MKKTFFILVFLCCLSAYSVMAQDTLQTMNTAQLAQKILSKIDHEVALSEQQKTEVMALLLERSENIKNLKANNKGKKLQKDYLAKVNEQSYNQLQNILSEEQFVHLQEIREATKKQKEKYPAEQVYLSDQDLELDF